MYISAEVVDVLRVWYGLRYLILAHRFTHSDSIELLNIGIECAKCSGCSFKFSISMMKV